MKSYKFCLKNLISIFYVSDDIRFKRETLSFFKRVSHLKYELAHVRKYESLKFLCLKTYFMENQIGARIGYEMSLVIPQKPVRQFERRTHNIVYKFT